MAITLLPGFWCGISEQLRLPSCGFASLVTTRVWTTTVVIPYISAWRRETLANCAPLHWNVLLGSFLQTLMCRQGKQHCPSHEHGFGPHPVGVCVCVWRAGHCGPICSLPNSNYWILNAEVQSHFWQEDVFYRLNIGHGNYVWAVQLVQKGFN